MDETPRKLRLWNLVLSVLTRLREDEAVALSGNIAFRTLFSLFPFLIFLTALSSLFGDGVLAEQLIQFLYSVGPVEIIEPMAEEVNFILTTPRTDLISVSFLVTIWAAMAGLDSVRIGLNRAYDVLENRSWLWLYSLGGIFIICTTFVLLAFSVLIVMGPVIVALIERYVPQAGDFVFIFNLFRFPVAVLLLAGILTAAHRWLPARRLGFKQIYPGVTLTVVTWIILASVYSQYLANFANFASFYAGLSGVFAALLFLYMAAIVLLLGGEVNRALMLR